MGLFKDLSGARFSSCGQHRARFLRIDNGKDGVVKMKRKAPLWDLVGLALTADCWRLLAVVSVIGMAGYLSSKFL